MRYCLIILIFLCHYSSFCQHEEWHIKDLLKKLERSSEIRFSFEENLIGDYTVQVTTDQLEDVSTFIPHLQAMLGLRFEQVNQVYYIIRPFNDSDRVDICGTVIDQEGKSVPGVLISGDVSEYSAVSDQDGYFSIKNVPVSLSFSLRHIGYNLRRSSAKELLDPSCSKLTLLESVGFLETLTVKDYLAVGIMKENNQVKIYPAEIKILPGHTEPDLMQSIQLSPGVNSPFETASGIHVRGGSPDQNLVLWNGIRTYNQGHFFGMLSAFNPYTTDEVTFIKSGTDSKYGERVSSVIDIQTTDKIPQDVTGGMGFNLLHADGNLHLPLIKDKLSVQLSGRRSYNDLVETPTYHRYAERVFQNTKIAESTTNRQANNRFFFHDFSTNVNYHIGKGYSLRFSSLFDNNSLQFETKSDSTGEKFTDQLNTKNEGYIFSIRRQDKRPLSFMLSGQYSKYLLSYAFNSLVDDTLDVATKKNFIHDYGMHFNTRYAFEEKHSIQLGYEYSLKQIRYAFEQESPTYSLVLDAADNRLSTHSLYTEYQLDYGRNSFLQFGSRFNYYQELEKYYAEPRLYLEQQVTNGFFLTASGEYRTQAVSQIRESVISDLSLENKVWTLAATDGFPLTTSYQVSAGSIFDKNNFYAEAEAYYKDISGITTLTFGFLNPVGNEFSIGNSSIKGFDLFVRKQFTGYKTWLSYSYIYSLNEFTGLNENKPFPGNWNIEHTVKWSHFYSLDRLQFSLGWLWHSGKAYTEVIEETSQQGPVVVAFDGINTHNLPVYHRLDASVVYDFQPKSNDRIKYRIGLSVLNIYNRKNQLNREYRTTPSLENRLIETNIYALGITPNLVFRMFW